MLSFSCAVPSVTLASTSAKSPTSSPSSQQFGVWAFLHLLLCNKMSKVNCFDFPCLATAL